MSPNQNVLLRPKAIYDECKKEHPEDGFEKKHALFININYYVRESRDNEDIAFNFKSE